MSKTRYARVSMRRMTRVGAVASFLALAMVGSYDSAEACGERLDGSRLSLDGFLEIDEPVIADPIESTAGGGCPVPPCSSSGCATVNPSTPFQRLASYEQNPISPHAGCFSIARRDANFYVQLTLDGPGNGFHRNVSTDGGFTWTSGTVVISPNRVWWNGIKCPDLQYLPNGDLLVYFTGGSATGAGIARAVSTDDGQTWTADPAPVLTSPVAGFTVDNPSVLRRSANNWVMAYTLACVGPGVTGPFQLAETYLASSTDGITWTHSPLNPALTPGSCGAWDQGAIANPVLLADPNSNSTLHLFYTGANWNGTTTRGCAKIGHAISTNNGRSWCKTGVVLDHPPATSLAWDDGQYMVSSFTLEPNNLIRMYYWAGDAAKTIDGLGIAEASWPLAGCGPAPQDVVRLGARSNRGLDSETGNAFGFELRAQPNPTSGGVMIQHDLPSGMDGSGSMTILDIQGRRIATIWSGELREAPAHFEWDGLNGEHSRVAAGRYLIRLERGGEAIATGWLTMMP